MEGVTEMHSGAVSFTNSYFALVDGLVSGFENCLAENVVLDWFGKTIKGKSNVAAFMNTHKVNSRHVFNDINPAENIGYNIKPNHRTTRRKVKISNELSQLNISMENSSSYNSTPLSEIVSSGDRSRSPSKIDAEGNRVKESNLTFELHDDAVSTLFKLENIKSTNVDEIREKIKQISLQDKMNIKSPRKNEKKDIKGSENIDIISSMKYVEAYGEILFSKKSSRQSGWNECKLISTSSTQTWRKACKLQIAYSSQKTCLQDSFTIKNSKALNYYSNFGNSQQKLLSLDQLTELSNKLVPNVNNFTGYLRNAKEEDTFLKNLGEYLSKNEAHKLGLVPQYINGQLVFQKMNCVSQEEHHNFIFNHLIHVIIYEGQSLLKENIDHSQTILLELSTSNNL